MKFIPDEKSKTYVIIHQVHSVHTNKRTFIP